MRARDELEVDAVIELDESCRIFADGVTGGAAGADSRPWLSDAARGAIGTETGPTNEVALVFLAGCILGTLEPLSVIKSDGN